MAAVGTAFGMRVTAWSPHLTEERATGAGARLVGKEELFATADFVSLHLVLADATRGIVGREELAAMRSSAYLVNTSRAGLVDTEALVEALDTGRSRAWASTCSTRSRCRQVTGCVRIPRVLATPHLGYVTHANYTTFFTEAVEDVAAWLAGSPVRELYST